MAKSIQPLIETLFRAENPSGRRLVFHWRLVQRQGRPLLLLPEDSMDLRTGLELYSAQRRRAKIWRAMLPKIIRSPAASLFRRIRFEADANSEFVRFLAEQSGVPAEQLRAPAIKFGGLGEKKTRLALLVCDQTNRPAKVIKVGLNAEGRAATEREADVLAQLPVEVIGCIRMSGRQATEKWSAFATPFFPGDSPENDAGLEIVFNSWLKLGEPTAIGEFDSWRELEKQVPAAQSEIFQSLTVALAGKKICSTLYHGDFTPWNLRAINVMNLQAYDWEVGYLRGIPGWDWFHFIVQTSILVKRHSPERVAAELEQLIQSPRFFKYAQAAGIEKIIEPLLLAYLLHQEHVIRPLQGRETTRRLFELLWLHWQPGKTPVTAVAIPEPKTAPQPASLQPIGAFAQISSAFANLMNLFWQPSLSHAAQPPFAEQLQRHWKALLGSLVWIVCLAQMPLLTNPHLMFAPFYLVPCIFMALRTDRRLASLIAFVSAFGGPLLFYWGNPFFAPLSVILWNGLMRYIVFQIVVVLFDRVRRQGILRPLQNSRESQNPIHAITGNWAVILLTVSFLLLVVFIDYMSGVAALMTGLYIIPCMLMTLALNWRWGTVLAVVCAVLGPMLQRPDPGYQAFDIQFWNTAMRFVMYEMVVLMIERVRRENILFTSSKPG
jgi:hypothetical protein